MLTRMSLPLTTSWPLPSSIDFNASAAYEILVARRGELSGPLEDTGPDQDLAGCDDVISPAWPAWKLDVALRSIDGVKRTKASKLIARKRPRLIPICDSIVGPVTNTVHSQWLPLREALQADGETLQDRLTTLARDAELPKQVSALRVLNRSPNLEARAGGQACAESSPYSRCPRSVGVFSPRRHQLPRAPTR